MRNAGAKRAKILFFIVKYANLWGFCCRRRRGCLSSLLSKLNECKFWPYGLIYVGIRQAPSFLKEFPN